MSFIARHSVCLLRRLIKPNLATLIRAARTIQPIILKNIRENPAPFCPEIAGDWTPAATQTALGAPLLFFLHGGGFLIGAPRLFRLVSREFSLAGFDVFAPTYRLAPEHVFPAALTDVVQAYKALVSVCVNPIVLAGDSAGGGLAVSMMMKLRDDGVRLPKAAVLFSPWTDLAATGQSMRLNEGKDAYFTRKTILWGSRAFLAQTRARNPLASPIYGNLQGLPPILAHVGADEVLRDDATRLIDQARAAGVDAQIEIWPDVPHAWQLLPFLPEAALSRQKAIEFLKEKLVGEPISAQC